MLQYLVKGQMSGRFNMADLQQYAAEELERGRPFLEAPRYFTTCWRPTCAGRCFCREETWRRSRGSRQQGHGEAFLAAIKNPPRSTEQILHPKKYWDPSRSTSPSLSTMLRRPAG